MTRISTIENEQSNITYDSKTDKLVLNFNGNKYPCFTVGVNKNYIVKEKSLQKEKFTKTALSSTCGDYCWWNDCVITGKQPTGTNAAGSATYSWEIDVTNYNKLCFDVILSKSNNKASADTNHMFSIGLKSDGTYLISTTCKTAYINGCSYNQQYANGVVSKEIDISSITGKQYISIFYVAVYQWELTIQNLYLC